MKIELTLEVENPVSGSIESRHFILKCGAKAVFEGYQHQLTREHKSICKDILESHAASISAIAKGMT